MSDKSATPILVAGAVGTVLLLGVAWMFAASTSRQAVVNAQIYAEEKAGEAARLAAAAVEPEATPEAEAPAEPEVAEAEAEQPAETEVAEAEAEQSAATEVAEAEPEKAEEPAATEVVKAEAEEPAETEAAEAEAEQPAATKIVEAEPEEAEEPATIEVVNAEAEEPAVVAEAEELAESAVASAQVETSGASEVDSAVAATTVATAVTGDASAGAKVFRKCKSCHRIGDGAKHSVGPLLTGVVGRVQGSAEGYGKYSDGFKAAMAEGAVWTPENLEAFLTKPKDYMPGTKMSFPGLRKRTDRANVIAYLSSIE